MRYENLQQLIQNSSSSRKYFLSLPVALQMELHEQNDAIRTAQDLHRRAEAVQSLRNLSKLGESLHRFEEKTDGL